MKKICLSLIVLAAFSFQFCSSSKKASVKQPAKITYMGNLQPIIVATCSPCHFPPKGNKKPYDTYASVKGDIDEIIGRISKNPNERGFMPMRHPKLSADTIQQFVQWKADGLMEK